MRLKHYSIRTFGPAPRP